VNSPNPANSEQSCSAVSWARAAPSSSILTRALRHPATATRSQARYRRVSAQRGQEPGDEPMLSRPAAQATSSPRSRRTWSRLRPAVHMRATMAASRRPTSPAGQPPIGADRRALARGVAPLSAAVPVLTGPVQRVHSVPAGRPGPGHAVRCVHGPGAPGQRGPAGMSSKNASTVDGDAGRARAPTATHQSTNRAQSCPPRSIPGIVAYGASWV